MELLQSQGIKVRLLDLKRGDIRPGLADLRNRGIHNFLVDIGAEYLKLFFEEVRWVMWQTSRLLRSFVCIWCSFDRFWRESTFLIETDLWCNCHVFSLKILVTVVFAKRPTTCGFKVLPGRKALDAKLFFACPNTELLRSHFCCIKTKSWQADLKIISQA